MGENGLIRRVRIEGPLAPGEPPESVRVLDLMDLGNRRERYAQLLRVPHQLSDSVAHHAVYRPLTFHCANAGDFAMSEKNETVVKRFIEECINRKKVELMDKLFSPDYINHAATSDISPDLEGYKERVRYMIAAFPDLSIAIEDLFSDGDRVAVRLTARGTHQGSYLGVPPTGELATWTAIAIYRVVDGRIVERWENRDDLGMMRQLGLLQG